MAKSGHHNARDRSAVVAPDPARAPSATTSKFWGVGWDKRARRWKAYYKDANGKQRTIGIYDTQEDAARRARGVREGRRKTRSGVRASEAAVAQDEPGR